MAEHQGPSNSSRIESLKVDRTVKPRTYVVKYMYECLYRFL